MLSPEEKEMLANIKALVAQLETMEGGAGAEEEPMAEAPPEEQPEVTMADDETMNDGFEKEDDEDEDGDAMKKAAISLFKDINAGSADSGVATGDDDAEERIEDIPEQSEKNINAVVKQLLKAGYRISKVNKSKEKKSPMYYAMKDLTKVIKALQQNQMAHGNAINGIIEGLKIPEQMKAVEKAKSSKPVATTDRDSVILEVAKALMNVRGDAGVLPGLPKPNERGDVRKSIGEALKYIVGQPVEDK